MDTFLDLRRYGDAPAVVDDEGVVYSYERLHRLVSWFGGLLPTGRRSLVLVRTANRIESVIGFLGTIAAGHVVLPVDHSVDRQQVRRLVDAYRPDHVWSEDTAPDGAPALGPYALVPTGHRAEPEPHPALSAVLLTSGSTGSPKGVRLTKDNFLANAASIAGYLELEQGERAVTSLPMSYSYGLSVITSHLHAGATVLLTDRSLVSRGFWDFFREHGATSFAGVPYTYEMLDALRFTNLELPSLRSFTQAGGRLAPDAVRRYAAEACRRSARFYVMYGQTEATARISYWRADLHPDRGEGIGTAIPGGELWLTDARGRPVTTPGEVGHLHYAGPNVMLGHAAGRADLARGDELRGELDTGDLARVDEEGHYVVVGRAGRFLKLSGVRVDLDEVERRLAEQGFRCAVAGRDEELAVAVEDGGAPGRGALDTAVRKYLRQAFHIDPAQVRLVAVERISRATNGKVAYGQIFGSESEGWVWTPTP
ncbi:AMP-binding protein [Actinokineospora sp. PR83]|uniref:AMP-binding protein n=1 Tax=Actinokineospora sp. PR83 TaxID=2884908 RepID=UPI0027DFCB03|nr:AMP-binding protein [Actinokineospora sp. PR83]MCG8915263.1 AMP-binding protein [Actinokineospora sp. PR83]